MLPMVPIVATCIVEHDLAVDEDGEFVQVVRVGDSDMSARDMEELLQSIRDDD